MIVRWIKFNITSACSVGDIEEVPNERALQLIKDGFVEPFKDKKENALAKDKKENASK